MSVSATAAIWLMMKGVRLKLESGGQKTELKIRKQETAV